MIEKPVGSIFSESMFHLKRGEVTDFADIWRHEGIKKGVEAGLYITGSNELGRMALRKSFGGPINDPRLKTNVAGLDMEGPIGLAPGWDKTGKTLHGWQALGARHITPGAVTFYGQAGNRMPRLRTMDNQIGDHGKNISLNAFGFWSPGSDKFVYNIQKQKEAGEIDIPIIVQVTLNKEFYYPDNLDLVADLIRMTVKKVLPVADAINLGLTSPNTMGMREAADKGDQFMLRVFGAARNEINRSNRKVPLIFKGEADGGEQRLEFYCKWAQYRSELLDAFELINTTTLPKIKSKYGAENLPGGLAGADPEYQQMALSAVKYVYEAVGGRVDIIGVGGVDSPKQALRMLEAGASAVGINTAVRKLGLGMMRYIEKGLIQEIDKKYPETKTLDQIIGSGTNRGPKHLTREKVEDKMKHVARRTASGDYISD